MTKPQNCEKSEKNDEHTEIEELDDFKLVWNSLNSNGWNTGRKVKNSFVKVDWEDPYEFIK